MNVPTTDLVAMRARARITMSPHVVSRMSTRHITEHEVLTTVLMPQRTRQSGSGHAPDRTVYCGPRIEVVLAYHKRAVVTVRFTDSSIPGDTCLPAASEAPRPARVVA